MRKIISFMHISLDGFVAGLNGEMDWITVNEEIFRHVGERISKGDTALYGRVTYDMMEGYWPTAADKPNATEHDISHAKWYQHVHKVVLSKTLKGENLSNTTVINENLESHITTLKQQDGEEVLIFGSPRATHALMELGLIDGYWLFVNPVVLGEGIPLFKGIKDRVKLQLQTTHTFSCGVVELGYVVTNS